MLTTVIHAPIEPKHMTFDPIDDATYQPLSDEEASSLVAGCLSTSDFTMGPAGPDISIDWDCFAE